jgi:hypothetical protein
MNLYFFVKVLFQVFVAKKNYLIKENKINYRLVYEVILIVFPSLIVLIEIVHLILN